MNTSNAHGKAKGNQVANEKSQFASNVACPTDSDLLQFFELNPCAELSQDRDPPDGKMPQWLVHLRNGPRNDTEWHLIGRGPTVRDAIRAAMSSDDE